MARNVFISFRFSDGHQYKKILANCFDRFSDTIDFSEDQDRSRFFEATIRSYLYGQLRRSSVTIILLTPNAVNHKKDYWGRYDDWMYDEIRYSLENRENNRPNGLIAVYTPEAEPYLIQRQQNSRTLIIRDVDNLFRKNMMNVKDLYKKNPEPGIYDLDYDSYCSLVSFRSFANDIGRYIDLAIEKRDHRDKYDIRTRLQEDCCNFK